MERIKHIILLPLIVLVFMLISVEIEAAEICSGTLGNNNGVTWNYDESKKVLTLMGEDSFNSYAWGDYENGSIFNNICGDVEKVILKNLKISGSADLMFSKLMSLKSIECDGFDSTYVTNMRSMFMDCSALECLDLSDFDTSNVTDMANMFAGCTSLRILDVSGFDTGNVTNMGCMFFKCSSLESLDASGFDTSKVTYMRAMFYECTNLSTVDVRGFDTSNVDDMVLMFNDCKKLTDLDLSNFITAQVLDISGMFQGCSSLNTLNISGFDTTNVSDMGNMFYGCSSLEKLDVSGFNTANVVNMTYMFGGCSSLKDLDLSGFDTTNVSDIGSMFSGCSSLEEVDVSGFNTTNVVNMGSMFLNCSGLKKLDVMNFVTSNVTTMSWMFAGCSNLGEIDVSRFDTGNVTDMGFMFYRDAKLQEIDLSSFDISKVKDTEAMFMGCDTLSIIHTPKTMDATLVIGLPTTFYNSKQKATAELTYEFCKDMLTKDIRPINPFADVKENSWQYTYVKFALENNLMAGKGKDAEGNIIFDPDKNMTRAEFVQTLYNKEGKPAVTYTDKFTDVPESAWFAKAIIWASDNGIVAGKGDKFDVNGNITREEVATILCKYATNYKQYDTSGRASLDAYEDKATISNWAVNNMSWAINYGVMKGRGTKLAPRDKATRAECATMLKNFMDAYEK